MAGALNVNDLIIHRSDRSGVEELSVTIHDFPANAPPSVTPALDAYTFWYRPRTEKGYTWITVPELELSHHHISRSHNLLSPPSLPVYGESQEAEGIVVKFSFSPRFFEAMAKEVGLSEVVSKRRWHHFFAIDQRTEALCRLLMEETEDQCPYGPLYFEPLARALALRVLGTVHDQNRKAAVPPGIRRAVQRLETDFAYDLSLDELASMAKMSRSHFAIMFRQLTGYTPHQYLLLVRLNHVRKLIGQRNPPLSLAEIAATTGFCDQAHLNRHFRRFFGTTPAAFRSQQNALEVSR
ncbi:MAG TPA: AraC family transcriptional regulator [Chthoniobacterales bacterium]